MCLIYFSENSKKVVLYMQIYPVFDRFWTNIDFTLTLPSFTLPYIDLAKNKEYNYFIIGDVKIL